MLNIFVDSYVRLFVGVLKSETERATETEGERNHILKKRNIFTVVLFTVFVSLFSIAVYPYS